MIVHTHHNDDDDIISPGATDVISRQPMTTPALRVSRTIHNLPLNTFLSGYNIKRGYRLLLYSIYGNSVRLPVRHLMKTAVKTAKHTIELFTIRQVQEYEL